MHYIYHSLC